MSSSWSTVAHGRGRVRKAALERGVLQQKEAAATRIQALFRGFRVRAERDRAFWRDYAETMYYSAGCEDHDLVGCAECRFRASGECPSAKEEGYYDDYSWGGSW